MKVALVILHADPSRGGAERYTADLATALAKRGEEVSLVSSSFGRAIPGVEQKPLAARGATRLAQYLRFLDSLDSHLSSNTYDVVHAMLPVRRCDIYHPHAGIAAESVARGHLKHPAMVARAISRVANRFNRKRQRFAAVEGKLLESAAPPLVLCLSDYVKATVQAHFPKLRQDRLEKLFNGVDLDRFDPSAGPGEGAAVRDQFKLTADDIVALMIAQDFQRKGLKEAILAFAKVPDPRLRLLVVGKENPAKYQRLAETLVLGRRVIFAGTTSNPYAYYQAANFFVLPTWHDPCSLVVLESLSMGVPVISTGLNGACEIMIDSKHGFILTDPSDEARFHAALTQMLEPAVRATMSAACLELRPALSQKIHVDELQRLYRRFK